MALVLQINNIWVRIMSAKHKIFKEVGSMDVKEIRVKSLCANLAYSFFVLLIICVVLQINYAYAGPAKYSLSTEKNTNRAGKDYKNFDLKSPNPEFCKAACEKDPKCKAYTYVKPTAK